MLEAAVLFAAFAAGLLLERALRRWARRHAARTATGWDDWLVERGFHWVPSGLLAVVSLHLFRLLRPDGVEAPFLTGVAQILLLLAGIRVAVDLVLASLRFRQQRFGLPAASILRNTVLSVAVVAAVLVVLDQAGVSIGPLLATLGVGALALAPALQPALGNLFAGIQLMAAGHFKVGDFIRMRDLDGLEGFVTDIGWRSTTLHTLLDNTITIPNSRLAEAVLTNLNSPDPKLRILVPVGVHYDSDLDEVDRVTREVIREVQQSCPVLVSDFAGDVRWTAFADSAVTFDAILLVNQPRDRFEAASVFIRAIHRRFGEEGIEIPYPIRNLYLRGVEKGSGFPVPGADRAEVAPSDDRTAERR